MPYVEERDLTASVRTGAPLSPIAAPVLTEWPHCPPRTPGLGGARIYASCERCQVIREGGRTRQKALPQQTGTRKSGGRALGKRRTMTGWAR